MEDNVVMEGRNRRNRLPTQLPGDRRQNRPLLREDGSMRSFLERGGGVGECGGKSVDKTPSWGRGGVPSIQVETKSRGGGGGLILGQKPYTQLTCWGREPWRCLGLGLKDP